MAETTRFIARLWPAVSPLSPSNFDECDAADRTAYPAPQTIQSSTGDDEAGALAMPEHLAAKFDALPATVVKSTPFATPVGPNDSHRTRIDLCVAALQHNGWALDEAIELARYFPTGFGALGDAAAPIIREEWQDRLARLAEHAEKKAQARAKAETLFNPWEDPAPPEWPGSVLSREAEDTLAAVSLRDGVDYGAQCLAHLAAASGAAPKNARFAPFRSWSVPPIIWVMLVAESGQRKTAMADTAFHPLCRLHGDRWSEYQAEMKRWRMLSQAEKFNGSKPAEPHSYIVNDCTPEKLQMILADNPRGTLLLKDELAPFFDFGRYSGGVGAAERAFYLESYEGGPYTVHRIGRDSLHITVNGLTIYGNIQPDRLDAFKGLESDGMLQRLAVVRARPAVIERPDVRVPNLDRLYHAIERLARLDGRRYTTTPDGAELILRTRREAAAFAEITDYGVGFQGFCRKLHGTQARTALILHLLENPQTDCIPSETVVRAYRLVRHFLLPHALGFYSSIPGSAATLRREIGGWLLSKAPQRVVSSDLVHNVKGCRPLGAKGIAEVLEPFVIGGWLNPESEYPSNRAWRLNLDVRAAFPERIS